ncbi:MAG: hypothetical protein GMKNLPBB_01191 [Myxococcota bacterium]|nr:hypothetical protein [Myxococcota bacterium]
MIRLNIIHPDGHTDYREFPQEAISIGRSADNDIVLVAGNVSKKHAQIVLKMGKVLVADNKSTNGTFLNGQKLDAPKIIKPGDTVSVGDFKVQLADDEAAPVDDLEEIYEPSASVASKQQRDNGKPVPAMPPPPALSPPVRPAPPAPNRPAARAAAMPPPPPLDDDDEDELDEADIAEEVELRPSTPQARPAIDRDRPAPKPAPAPPPGISPSLNIQSPERPKPAPRPRPGPAPAPGKAPGGGSKIEQLQELQREIHNKLIVRLDLRRINMDKLGEEGLRKRATDIVQELINETQREGRIPSFVDKRELLEDILNEALGLGPLEDLLADPEVSEIMVNHSKQIYVERSGKIGLSDKTFSSDQAVLGVIERIVAPLGRRIDESQPYVDARLKDGSRVNAIIPPLALKGPCITIRKFKKEKLRIDDLIRFSSLSRGMADFIEMCVRARKNIVISGGTGSGKTTLLNVMSSFIPDGERIVTVEDAAELQLPQEHVVSLETRPPNIEGKGEITIRDLVRNSLRMRPDRIVVGECRGGEALDMLQAMNTGHDGSMTTVHANAPRDAMARLETLVLMAGMELPVRAIREQIASAVNIIVQQQRFSDGSRRITHITEVSGMEVDVVTMQDIFTFKQEGFDSEGRVKGKYVATGFVPRFYDDLQRRGIPVNMRIFHET